jgi:hypothetical protein
MNDIADKILESGLADALKVAPGSDRLTQVPRVEPSLPDQIAQLERIERTIEDKIRRERVAVITAHDERWTKLRTNYTRDLSDMQSRLSRDLAVALKDLEAETAAKLHQLDQIEKRRG